MSTEQVLKSEKSKCLSLVQILENYLNGKDHGISKAYLQALLKIDRLSIENASTSKELEAIMSSTLTESMINAISDDKTPPIEALEKYLKNEESKNLAEEYVQNKLQKLITGIAEAIVSLTDLVGKDNIKDLAKLVEEGNLDEESLSKLVKNKDSATIKEAAEKMKECQEKMQTFFNKGQKNHHMVLDQSALNRAITSIIVKTSAEERGTKEEIEKRAATLLLDEIGKDVQNPKGEEVRHPEGKEVASPNQLGRSDGR